MSIHATSPQFKANAHAALGDAQLQKAMGNVKAGFIDKRVKAIAKLPEFEALRDSARDIKDHTLAHLARHAGAARASRRRATTRSRPSSE